MLLKGLIILRGSPICLTFTFINKKSKAHHHCHNAWWLHCCRFRYQINQILTGHSVSSPQQPQQLSPSAQQSAWFLMNSHAYAHVHMCVCVSLMHWGMQRVIVSGLRFVLIFKKFPRPDKNHKTLKCTYFYI
jgi:hypothetical protein